MLKRTLIIAVTSIALLALSGTTGFAADAPDPAKLYKKCMGCHSKDGKGNPKFRAKKNPNLPDFSDPAWKKKQTHEKVRKGIAEGVPSPCKEGPACNVEKGHYKGKMKGYAKKYSAEELDILTKYVLSFGK